jgi:hypothetical protein
MIGLPWIVQGPRAPHASRRRAKNSDIERRYYKSISGKRLKQSKNPT